MNSRQWLKAALLAFVVLVAGCGGGGTVEVVHVTDPTPTPTPPPFDSTVAPVLSLRQGTPDFFTIPPSSQLYAEVIVDAKDTAGNPKAIGAVQNGTPAGVYDIRGPAGSPAMQVGFTDTAHTAVRAVMMVTYSTTYSGTFTLPDSFGNVKPISIAFTTPDAPVQPTTFTTTLRNGYPQFAVNGQVVSTTIIIDSNHTLAMTSNGFAVGTISVADASGSTVTTTVASLGPNRNAVQFTATGTFGTAYVATVVLQDVDGNQKTLSLPFTTPAAPPPPPAFAISVRQGYPAFAVSGQGELVTIIVDANHALKVAPNGVTPWGTIGVSGGTGPSPAFSVGFTDSTHTSVMLQFVGAHATNYSPFFTLEDTGGATMTLTVPVTTP